ncbi:MAG TPA: ABC transporter ATP-binding protein, partial [Gemmatimonadales bacterium]|nr:ABC transporter ATP-binding protein [Gemmatimonadales bacterium]
MGPARPGQRPPGAVSHAPFLTVAGLEKRFGGHAAVRGVGFSLARGEVLALLGPSGSGKTTTLRLLGGFEAPDAGRIVVDGAEVTALPPAARQFGVVFQHYALFPHLDVAGNVGFGLESRGVRPGDRTAPVAEALALVDLAGFERRRIGELSGGQQQRVALARALVIAPRILLLDEPLSNLDPSLRERTRAELRALIRRTAITTVLVTHEQDDAFDLADRVAILEAGQVAQVGTPDELYRWPTTPFVAGFIGRSSLLRGEVTGDGALHAAGGVLPAPPGLAPGPVRVVARPEAFRP